MTLHVAEEHDLYSSMESKSTTAEELGIQKDKINSIKVRVRPLDAILMEAGACKIKFISIDVDGHEMEVLSGFDLNQWNPIIVIIEYKSDLMITPVESYMKAAGYQRFYRSGGNDWYAKRSVISAYFMLKMLMLGYVKISGLLKVWLPRNVARWILLTSRSLMN